MRDMLEVISGDNSMVVLASVSSFVRVHGLMNVRGFARATKGLRSVNF